jgi:hypothetical protein
MARKPWSSHATFKTGLGWRLCNRPSLPPVGGMTSIKRQTGRSRAPPWNTPNQASKAKHVKVPFLSENTLVVFQK